MTHLQKKSYRMDIKGKDKSGDVNISQDVSDLVRLPPKWDTLRIAQELVGLRMQKQVSNNLNRKRERSNYGHGRVFSFGNYPWQDSEKFPQSLRLNYLLDDFKKKMEGDNKLTQRMKKVVTNSKSLPSPIRSSGIGLNKKFGFTMVGDWHRAVRNYMKDIGWHEKFTSPIERQIITRALQRPIGRESTEAAKFISQNSVDFIWAVGYINWCAIHSSVVVSRIPAASLYFSKNSLSVSLKNLMPFIYKKDERNVRIPRTYEIRGEEDMKHFSKQFRINACICMLKNFYLRINNDKKYCKENADNKEKTVQLDCVEFAVRRVAEFFQFMKHADLDDWSFSVVNEEDWDSFFLSFRDVAYNNFKFQMKNNYIDGEKLSEVCHKLLHLVYELIPEMMYEGYLNLWIIKPANGSCGRGVKIFRTLADIQNYCHFSNNYVIQKYIEMPLLIYKTKFDIRQWFIISSVAPLVIWMYEECYLRFCSQEFSLQELHESVHLCNNTIQWKYKNGVRDSRLPEDNMWDSNTFEEYLRNVLNVNQWSDIQDQMRQAIIAACIATQEKMFHRPNSFHLYGADFMLTPDFQVWLIEINCTPSMKYSTSITTRMCKAVLEDTLKVGLERKFDPSVSTGQFREIYRQASVPSQVIFPFGRQFQSRRVKLFENDSYDNSTRINNTNNNSDQMYLEFDSYNKQKQYLIKHKLKTLKPLDPGDSVNLNSRNEFITEDVDKNLKEKIKEKAVLPTESLDNNFLKNLSGSAIARDNSQAQKYCNLSKLGKNTLKNIWKKERSKDLKDILSIFTPPIGSKRKSQYGNLAKSNKHFIRNKQFNYKAVSSAPLSKRINSRKYFDFQMTLSDSAIKQIIDVKKLKGKGNSLHGKEITNDEIRFKNTLKYYNEKTLKNSLKTFLYVKENEYNEKLLRDSKQKSHAFISAKKTEMTKSGIQDKKCKSTNLNKKCSNMYLDDDIPCSIKSSIKERPKTLSSLINEVVLCKHRAKPSASTEAKIINKAGRNLEEKREETTHPSLKRANETSNSIKTSHNTESKKTKNTSETISPSPLEVSDKIETDGKDFQKKSVQVTMPKCILF